MRRTTERRDGGVSSVIGAILVTALVFSLLLTVRLNFVPVWEKESEGAHLVGVERQLATIQSEIERQVDNRTAATISHALTLEREQTGIFRGNPSTHHIEFDGTGSTMNISSNKLLIITNNGISISGLNPNWQPFPTDEFEDVADIQSLRIRIAELSRDFVGEEINLTIFDVNDDLLGWFSVSAYDEPSEFVIQYNTYQAPDIKIAEYFEALHQLTSFEDYYIDVLDAGLLVDNILASGEGPYTIEMAETSGVDAEYTMTYTQETSGGGIIIGSSGVEKEPYAAEYGGGRLIYSATSSYHVAQTYVLENGALILSQSDGDVFKVPPAFSVQRSGSIVDVDFLLPSLQGSSHTISGADNTFVITESSGNSEIFAQAPRLQFRVQTDFPDLWGDYFEDAMADVSLSSTTVPPQFTIDVNTEDVELTIYGTTADPVSEAYDLSFTFRQADIEMTVDG